MAGANCATRMWCGVRRASSAARRSTSGMPSTRGLFTAMSMQTAATAMGMSRPWAMRSDSRRIVMSERTIARSTWSARGGGRSLPYARAATVWRRATRSAESAPHAYSGSQFASHDRSGWHALDRDGSVDRCADLRRLGRIHNRGRMAELGRALRRVRLEGGGLIEASYDPTARAGDPNNTHNRILAYLPQRMFAFRAERAPSGCKPAELLPGLHSVVEFESIDSRRTRVRRFRRPRLRERSSHE